MAKDTYTSEISPDTFLLQSEEDQGLVNSTFPGVNTQRRSLRRKTTQGRNKMELAEIKASMAALWKQDNTYVEIAMKINEEFNISEDETFSANSVSYHIKSLLDANRKSAMLHINERQAMILARYDQLEMLATEAYFASMESKTTHYERMIKRAKTKDRMQEMVKSLERGRKAVDNENKKRAKNHRPKIKFQEPDPIIGEMPDILQQTAENIKEYSRLEEKPAGDPRWIAMLIDITDRKAKLFGLLNRSDVANPDQELAKLSDEERRARMAAVLHTAMTTRTQDTGMLAPAGPLGGFKEGEEPISIIKADPEEVIEFDTVVEWEFD